MSSQDMLTVIMVMVIGIYVAVCAHAGHAIGKTIKQPMRGFYVGLLLGVLGLLIMWVFDEPPLGAQPEQKDRSES